jgi:hypothetical protein
VARAVDVGVVAVVRGVLNVGGRDGDASLSLLGGLVDGAILEEVGQALFGLSLGDGSGESGLKPRSISHRLVLYGVTGGHDDSIYLSVIDVANGTYITESPSVPRSDFISSSP